MLTDISNDLSLHNSALMRSQRELQHQQTALRPLRIVNRRFLGKGASENIAHSVRTGSKTATSGNNNNNINNTRMNSILYNNNKILDAPAYKFPKIYEQETDVLFPFYDCKIEREYKTLRTGEVKLDFTNDVNFHKNITKKYSKPIEVSSLAPKRLFKIGSSQQQASSSNIFFRSNNEANGDPVLDSFIHMKSENQLRFGEFLLTIAKDGSVSSKHSPIKEAENALLFARRSTSEKDFNDEELYGSDEGEVSRLENSDLDITESEDSDVELDLDLELKDEGDAEDEGFEGDLSIINSSLISQGISPFAIDSLQSGLLTNDKRSKSSTSHVPLSPLKRAMVNQSNVNSGSSPQKHDLLFRTLKNKSSPIKALKSQRSGVNLTQVSKPKKNKHTNYAKWDNSMTISAKAIMKMVDDSLVSSDTELYNHSCSYMAMKSFSKCSHAQVKDDININAADLMGALSGEVDSPLTRRLKDLKLQ